MNRLPCASSAFALALSAGPVVAADFPSVRRRRQLITRRLPSPVGRVSTSARTPAEPSAATTTSMCRQVCAAPAWTLPLSERSGRGSATPTTAALSAAARSAIIINSRRRSLPALRWIFRASPAAAARNLLGRLLNPTYTFGGTASASQRFGLPRDGARPHRLFVHAELARLCDGWSRLWRSQETSFSPAERNAAGAFVGSAIGGANASNTQVGWTVGGGLEWMFAQNWSVKFEYLYYDLGNASVNGPVQYVNAVTGATGLGVSQTSAQFNGHIVRAGVNYHFNWGAPA